MSKSEKTLSPLMGMLKPLAKKYITQDNIDSVFDAATAGAGLLDDEKAVILLSRAADGRVYAGVYAYARQRRTITREFSRMPVEELILSFLK